MCSWTVFLTVHKGHKWPSDFRLQLCWQRQEKKASPKSSDSTSRKQLIQEESSGLSILSVTYYISQSILLSLPSLSFLGFYLSPSSKRSRVTSPASTGLRASSSALRTPHSRPQLSTLYSSRLHSLQLRPSVASCAGLLSPWLRAEIRILSHILYCQRSPLPVDYAVPSPL